MTQKQSTAKEKKSNAKSDTMLQLVKDSSTAAEENGLNEDKLS